MRGSVSLKKGVWNLDTSCLHFNVLALKLLQIHFHVHFVIGLTFEQLIMYFCFCFLRRAPASHLGKKIFHFFFSGSHFLRSYSNTFPQFPIFTSSLLHLVVFQFLFAQPTFLTHSPHFNLFWNILLPLTHLQHVMSVWNPQYFVIQTQNQGAEKKVIVYDGQSITIYIFNLIKFIM